MCYASPRWMLWINVNKFADRRDFGFIFRIAGMRLEAGKLILEVPGSTLESDQGASIGGLDNLVANMFADFGRLYRDPTLSHGGQDGAVRVESAGVDEEGKDGDKDVDAADLENVLIRAGSEGGIDESGGGDGQ